MAGIVRVVGRLEAKGPVQYERDRGNYAIYDYIRFQGEDQTETYLQRVCIPTYLDSSISIGSPAEFHIVTLSYPKIFGSRDISYVYAVTLNGKTKESLNEVRRCFSSSKWGALNLFLVGIILLPAFGFGVLLWIAGLRLLGLALPEQQMNEDIKIKG